MSEATAGARAPIERKVTASSTAAAVAGALVWLLETTVLHGAVPEPIVTLIYVAVPGLCALAAGFFAKHTWRSDPEALRTKPYIPPPGSSI
ncbi:hypothetical protein ACFFMN_23080 [Planobispora siamensis]|uniref:Uncharacterized protein n=1 Tax=Planobispora siamensis TaxID=936338 RepID=A0A8J3SJI6_9ACTN|nr:hypothetical protein [Planobispora siamensis]GIH95452.1 hypothetical protein Psi01_60820 [Planobispora siamensis]